MSTDASLLTVREAAEFLRQSEQTIRRRLREGTLPGFHSGDRGAWRIPKQALQQAFNQATHAELKRQFHEGPDPLMPTALMPDAESANGIPIRLSIKFVREFLNDELADDVALKELKGLLVRAVTNSAASPVG